MPVEPDDVVTVVTIVVVPSVESCAIARSPQPRSSTPNAPAVIDRRRLTVDRLYGRSPRGCSALAQLRRRRLSPTAATRPRPSIADGSPLDASQLQPPLSS